MFEVFCHRRLSKSQRETNVDNVNWLVCRNMSVDGGQEACEEMVTQDIMTPLVALLQQVSDYVSLWIERPIPLEYYCNPTTADCKPYPWLSR